MYIKTVLFNVIITSLQEGHNKLSNKHHKKKIIRQKTIVKILIWISHVGQIRTTINKIDPCL